MPYKMIQGSLPLADINEFWCVRVHIDPIVLKSNDPNNKISLIEGILTNVFQSSDPVELKIYTIPTEDDGHDGALSTSGKDRTEVGKEVCIFLPDAHFTQLSAETYRAKLLRLWHELQVEGIPLLYMNVPGDRAITVNGVLPTPFSVTSTNPTKDDWQNPHGILFKQFNPCNDQHPILDVEFSLKDLQEHNIQFTEQELLPTHTFLNNHRDTVKAHIKNCAENIADAPEIYGNRLGVGLGLEPTKQMIKDLITEYETINQLPLSERGAAQEAFGQKLEANQAFQAFMSGYPRTLTRGRLDEGEIGRFQNIKSLEANQVDALFQTLQEDFSQKIVKIIEDYQERAIDLGIESFCFAGDKLATFGETYACKKPHEMQVLFKNIHLLNQELLSNTSWYNLNEPAGKAALWRQALEAYRIERASNSAEYYSFFGGISTLFGAHSRTEKLAVVDKLITALAVQDSNIALTDAELKTLTQGSLGALVKAFNMPVEAWGQKQNIEQREEGSGCRLQ